MLRQLLLRQSPRPRGYDRRQRGVTGQAPRSAAPHLEDAIGIPGGAGDERELSVEHVTVAVLTKQHAATRSRSAIATICGCYYFAATNPGQAFRSGSSGANIPRSRA